MTNKKVIVNGVEHSLSIEDTHIFKSTHSDNTSVREYEIVYDSTLNQSFFVIPKHTPWIDDRILNNEKVIKKIIDYTQRENNNIVKVYNITKDYIITEYNKDYYPFLIKSSTNFYDEKTFKERSNIHLECFKDRNYAKTFHKNVLDEYQKFNDYTSQICFQTILWLIMIILNLF